MRNLSPAVLAVPLMLLLAACSESPKTETAKEPAKPVEPLTGRQAFQKMYPAARSWALDATPFRVRDLKLSQVKGEKGKAGAWEAVFVSQSLAKSRTYTYSTIEAEGNLHQGVFAGLEEGYVANTRGPTFPFDISAIKFDSDQAYEAAVEKSADYIKKNPDKPMTFILERTNRFPDLTWRVIWGDSVSTSDYSVYVDATTGKFLEKMH
jgi:hypothetical protein